MKRLLPLLVIVPLAILLSGCGSSDKSSETKTATPAKPTVTNAWVRTTVEGQPTSAAYMTIKGNDKLVGVSVDPSVAASATIHQSMSADQAMEQSQTDKTTAPEQSGQTTTPNTQQMEEEAKDQADKALDQGQEAIDQAKEQLPDAKNLPPEVEQQVEKGLAEGEQQLDKAKQEYQDQYKDQYNSSQQSADQPNNPSTNQADEGMGSMAEMSPVQAVPVNGTLDLSPGGYHIMLEGLVKPIGAGEKVQITLTFEKAGNVSVEAVGREQS